MKAEVVVKITKLRLKVDKTLESQMFLFALSRQILKM